MKKLNNRILVVICAVCLVFSVFGNIAQHNQIMSLQDDADDARMRLKSWSERAENLEEELAELKSDYEFEIWMRELVERDYKVLSEATFEAAKQTAIEEGFNPDELDWFLNNQGHWCFFS